ncbi:D-glycero-alpha-D-manno-heptose-1,7-bisphosphate 7-phosphatase [Streptomyces sp. V1I6]|uniref:D-glycero-alpha-D-manno-heptose-1,7-bisphosphate 7-phosphatase n=1 Tax=Streptomyces sp. V1I6 TaxID=3042273 RepID=UPI00277F8B4C|nr:D-glycero-D-manno-heptose 1,7-bisphosphate phosphatase [Streptomyces sp. V1I6]
MNDSSEARPPRGPERHGTGPWLFHGPQASRGAPLPPDAADLPDAVLFDRDGTLVVDVPYNGDPTRVVPMPSAWEALAALRALGMPVGVVSNQSGVARGKLTFRQVSAVQRRIDALLGPFAVWAVCPHGPDDGCRCRKPAPGLVLAACERLGVCPSRTVVIGDIGSDVTAALAAGARGVLVPTAATRPEEITAAPETAPDLLRAVRLVLDPAARCGKPAAPPAGADRRERAVTSRAARPSTADRTAGPEQRPDRLTRLLPAGGTPVPAVAAAVGTAAAPLRAPDRAAGGGRDRGSGGMAISTCLPAFVREEWP